MTQPSPLQAAHAVSELAAFLRRAGDRESRWAIGGPGVVALRTGTISIPELTVIGSGDAMIVAMHERAAGTGNPLADSIAMDAAYTPKRLRFDRRSVSRAYRFALHNAEAYALELGGATVGIPVLRPFDAYIAELARIGEQRGSAERAAIGDRALELYRSIGATTIDDMLSDLHLKSGPELAALGLRRRDVDAFRLWHDRFLSERSPKAKPPLGGRLSAAMRGAGQWMSGSDLHSHDGVDR